MLSKRRSLKVEALGLLVGKTGLFLYTNAMDTLKKIAKFVVSVGVVFAAAGLGSVFTMQGIPIWYDTLSKPPLLPPNEVFGPAWSVLYFLIGVALFLVWNAPRKKKTGMEYIAFFAQLVLNVAWCGVFFALELPWLGVVVILLLIGAILWAMREFVRVSKPAMWLFVPYLLWTLFATYLTIGVAVLN